MSDCVTVGSVSDDELLEMTDDAIDALEESIWDLLAMIDIARSHRA